METIVVPPPLLHAPVTSATPLDVNTPTHAQTVRRPIHAPATRRDREGGSILLAVDGRALLSGHEGAVPSSEDLNVPHEVRLVA